MKSGTVFVDWLDIRQDHSLTHSYSASGVPFSPHSLVYSAVRARGHEVVTDELEDGNVYVLLRGKMEDKKNVGFSYAADHRRGSFDTSLLFHSDGKRARISGNVGRFNRPDNLFNYSFEETVGIANDLARDVGMPAFSRGLQYHRGDISDVDRRKGVSPWIWSGACLNEIHLTCNFYAGSDAQAVEALRYLQGRRMSRVSKAAFGTETVSFGMPTKKSQRLHRAIVCYRKAPEMLAHARDDAHREAIKKSPEYQLAADTGIVRVETKYGPHFLRERNLRYLGDIQMGKLIALYQADTAPLLQVDYDNHCSTREVRLVEHMPAKLRLSALSWINGHDLSIMLPRATFFRHRKELLEYGLDISCPRSVAGTRPNAEEALQRHLDNLPTLSLRPLDAPDWYALPERMAA